MTALVRLPHRSKLRAVLVLPAGIGWHVGVGRLASGEIEGERKAFVDARKAEEAAFALADAEDLIAVLVE